MVDMYNDWRDGGGMGRPLTFDNGPGQARFARVAYNVMAASCRDKSQSQYLIAPFEMQLHDILCPRCVLASGEDFVSWVIMLCVT